MKPFRLTSWEPKESALQKQIVQYLRLEMARGRVSWFCRINGGIAKYGKYLVKNYFLYLLGKPAISKGYTDLHGMLKGGRYFALEVKKQGEIATDEQREFMETVREGGGIGCTVFGFEDVPSVLFGEINPERNTE